MTILVTGASGFIGSFVVQEALDRGLEVWAGVRRSSSREYLQDPRIQWAELDFANPSQLKAQLLEYKQRMLGHGWDYIVHAAGATKCLRKEDFFKQNREGTRNFIEALRETSMIPQRFVFLSSLSVFGAIREQPTNNTKGLHQTVYNPILPDDIPQPNTAYGQSKWQAEQFLVQQTDFPYTILRPTGVYGPREKDYFLMVKSIGQHIDTAVGFRPQEITFVYVMDVVHAIFQCLQSPAAQNKAYFLSDGRVYDSRRFSELIRQEMGNPWVLRLRIPLCLLKVICWISGKTSLITGKVNALNEDKYHILSQRNWQCDILPACQDFYYKPAWTLEQGVAATVKWYKKNGWIK